MARRRTSTLLALVFLLGACGSTSTTAAPASEATAGASQAPSATAAVQPSAAASSAAPTASAGQATLRWVTSGPTQSTGLKVPLDYGNPSAGTITLGIARRPATDQAHRIGSLFLNPGGPGGTAIWMLSWSGLDSMIPKDVLDRFDLVTWDPRGTGASGGITCPDSATSAEILALDPNPASQSAIDAYHAVFKDIAGQCKAAGGSILPYLSEANTVRDMDSIRQALGEAAISYDGWSYGSYLGYLYATMFPTHLRAAVLDGPVDPNFDLVTGDNSQARGFEIALGHFFALCAASKACAFHGGGQPAAAFEALLAKVRRAPLAVEGQGTLGPGAVTVGVASYLFSQDAAGLAQALADAEHGDGAGLLTSAKAYYAVEPYGNYLQTICLDVVGPTTAGGVVAAYEAAKLKSPHFAAWSALDFGCLDWPVPPQPVKVATPPSGLPPILVVASRWDPATPPSMAEPLATALGTAVILERDGIGHTSGGSVQANACLGNALTAYLTNVATPPPGTVCTDPPVSFQP